MANQIPPQLAGVFAALPTPFDVDGSPALDPLDTLVDFVLAHGVKGLCLGGATSEYAACSVEHRLEMLRRVARRTRGRADLICGVGAEHAGQVRQLARAAAECGAVALLFPPPIFLPYAQSDLVDFMAEVSAELPLPVLIYYIPQFTRDLGIENVLRLIATIPNIVGLKDSSGNREHLAEIQGAQSRQPLGFMIGSDDLLVNALEHGAMGCISGIASACPELVVCIHDAVRAGRLQQARTFQIQLDDFIAHIREIAVPWSIKLALQTRGVGVGAMAWPAGPALRQKVADFQGWFSGRIDTFSGKAVAGGSPGLS